ncbi:DHH family phosphoesterase [Methanoplanus sp. FWC-SCC4]|uniref:DHH family phosphoesterase n=1 Tax=Methanochimaera problematica TaxID=2609417 RepID=A0AA97FA26_9EURY|nr:DHH family phosphoesterase [Methanoplanus sp. FWC-SCC4]WOF15635.1 DHH family phosphoesterase [Methanoplanus sp. FWC-SCC4]
MSIEAAAGHIAEKLSETEFVRVYGHHDADGIASATIMCHALHRLGKKFHLTIKNRISSDDIKNDEPTLLCDLGASLEELPDDTVVIDHHVPYFNGEYHINPRLHNIDGEKELSSSGLAYLVANHMGDNRDLCGLAILGMIGDKQTISGKNQEIVTEGIGNQIIVPKRGLTLAGRDTREKLYTATDPYLPGISGNLDSVDEILLKYSDDDDYRYEDLNSMIILKIAEKTNETAMQSLWGNTYELERGVIHDAHSLAAVVESCGLSNRGGLGVTLCLRNTENVKEAWEIAIKHRLNVISEINSAKTIEEELPVFEISKPSVSSCVADTISNNGLYNTPVFTIARNDDNYSVSARCPPGVEFDLSEFMKNLAEKTGGSGGGHFSRAGGIFGEDGLSIFKNEVKEALT